MVASLTAAGAGDGYRVPRVSDGAQSAPITVHSESAAQTADASEELTRRSASLMLRKR